MTFNKCFKSGPLSMILALALNFSLALFVGPAAQAQVAPTATRGLEETQLDRFVTLMNQGKVIEVAGWFRERAAAIGKGTYSPFLQSYQSKLMKLALFLEGNSQVSGHALAQYTFDLQQDLREEIVLTGDLEHERKAYVLLQNIIEESLLSDPGARGSIVFHRHALTEAEKLTAGTWRGLAILPGDVIVQLGAKFLSSHFIAHSQTYPGLGSHSYVISRTGAQPEILEALIEDGVNRRDPTTAELARMWVLSSANPRQRSDVAAATERFIQDEKIPFVPDGKHGSASPLLYDSTMNPTKKAEGKYFCTALVQEIYSRAGIHSTQNPFVETGENWNSLKGLEKAFYHELDIVADRVPAPTDALFQSQLAVRGLVLDIEGLRASRRLRATIDALFDILQVDSAKRNELLMAFRNIPKLDVKKEEILRVLDQTIAQPKGLDADVLRQLREQVISSLPQTANLRQIAFFMLLNSVIQDQMLASLEQFEARFPRKIAPPGALRRQSYQILAQEIQRVRKGLEVFAQAAAGI